VKWLGVKIDRYVMPWDAIYHAQEIAEADAWLTTAHAEGVQVLISFDHSAYEPLDLPSVAEYIHAVSHIMARYPWVRDYSTWNEETHSTEPTNKNPTRAAQYYNALTKACRGCTIVAAEVLDEAREVSWVRTFLLTAHHPRLWGLHPYSDLNLGQTSRTEELLSLVQGDIWFTEVGGLVWRYNSPTKSFVDEGTGYAATAASHLLSLARISPRITRVYYYQWRNAVPLTTARREHGLVTWDSGLVNPNCSIRPAFDVIARDLGRNPANAPRAVETSGAFACVSAPGKVLATPIPTDPSTDPPVDPPVASTTPDPASPVTPDSSNPILTILASPITPVSPA
jgi:hypothetical protein